MRTLSFLIVPLVCTTLTLEACGGGESTSSGTETGIDGGSNAAGSAGSAVTGSGGSTSQTGAGGSSVGMGGSTGVGGSSVGMGGSTGTGGSSAIRGCPNPTPYLVSNGVASVPGDTGYEKCGNGVIHRRAPVVCPLGPTADVSPCLPRDGQCTSDAECTARFPHGICANAHKLLGYCGCFPACYKDDECPAGSICLCGGNPAGSCVPATCTGDADCPAGHACLSSTTSCAGGMGPFACDKPEDECIADLDCPAGKTRCVLQATGRKCVAACVLTPGSPQ